MFNSRFSGLLTGLLIAAIVGIIGLIGFFGWSVFNKYYLNSEAHKVVESFEDFVGNNNNEDEDGDRLTIGDVEDSDSLYNKKGDSTTYYGYEVLGTISIPKIDIAYPILEKVSPQSIKVAVAVLTGSGINKVRKYCNTRTQL